MNHVIDGYEDYLTRVKQASQNTIASYMRDIHQYVSYLNTVIHLDVLEADRDTIVDYTHWLSDRGKSPATISRTLASLKSFYTYAVSQGAVAENPVRNIHVEKTEKKLPQILTGKEVELLLEQPKCTDLKGYRDKAMLELLYATGIRVTELINLNVGDVSLTGSFIKCVSNDRMRIIPLYPAAVRALGTYINDIRPKLIADPDEVSLFVNLSGERMSVRASGRSSSTTRRRQKSTRISRRTRCGTASRHICWKTARICAPSRRCWGTATSRPHRFMRSW